MFRKILKFLVIMILSWVLLIGGVAAAGYILLTQQNSTGKLADTVGGVLNQDIQLDDDVAALSILEYATNMIGMVANIGDTNVGDLEGYIGMPLLSDNLNEVIGIDKETAKATTIGDLPEAITSSVTLATAVDKFGISLPSMPLFSDEEFMGKSLSTAFGDMTAYPLENFIKVTYDEDATEENPASPIILQKFGKYSLDEINKDSQSIIDSFSMGDLLKITESSPKILQALKDSTVATQYNPDGSIARESISDALKNTKIKDLINVGTAKVWTYLGEYTLDTLGTAVDEMVLGDVIEITDSSYPLLKRLQNTKVSKLGTAIEDAIYETTYDELMGVSKMSNPSPILVALKDTKIKNTSQKLNTLTVGEVYPNCNYGVLSLIPSDTTLTSMPAALVNSILNEDVYTLVKLGIININLSSTSKEAKSYFLNSTLLEVATAMPKLLDDGTYVATLLPTTFVYSGSSLTQGDLDNLKSAGLFEEGMTIKLTTDVSIPDSTTFTSVFNVDTDAYTLTIGNNVAFDVDGGYAFFDGNVVGSVTISKNINITSTYSVPAYEIER